MGQLVEDQAADGVVGVAGQGVFQTEPVEKVVERALPVDQTAAVFAPDDVRFLARVGQFADQGFHCLELADDGVFPGHLLCAEGKHNGHNGGKCLRNGRYRQRHGKEERIHHVFMAQKYADGKQHCTDDQNTNGQLPAELIQAHLQRGFLLLGALEQSGNLAHLRIHPGTSNQELCTAIGDKAAGKHHVLPVAQRSVTRDLSQFLFHRQALSCQGAFRTLKAGTLQQAPVGAYGISRLQHHHITRHHIPARYLKHTAIPNYLGSGGGHLLETVQ